MGYHAYVGHAWTGLECFYRQLATATIVPFVLLLQQHVHGLL
jgi:hypothetical protein